MNTAATKSVTFLIACIACIALPENVTAVHPSQARLSHMTTVADSGNDELQNLESGVTVSPISCHENCQHRSTCHGGGLQERIRGKIRTILSPANPSRWHTPSDNGAGTWFNCRCNGSYKFPVPPLSTYHWPVNCSNQSMTDYNSPWRFPDIRPFAENQGALTYHSPSPTKPEQNLSVKHQPVSY